MEKGWTRGEGIENWDGEWQERANRQNVLSNDKNYENTTTSEKSHQND